MLSDDCENSRELSTLLRNSAVIRDGSREKVGQGSWNSQHAKPRISSPFLCLQRHTLPVNDGSGNQGTLLSCSGERKGPTDYVKQDFFFDRGRVSVCTLHLKPLSSAHRIMMNRVANIPGLFYADQFLSKQQQKFVLPSIRRVLKYVEEGNTGQAQTATVPQATRSKHHNLVQEERSFVRVQVPDLGAAETPVRLNAENFSSYGSRGHSLTYFRGNDNVPSFGHYGT